jgi:spermidine/putrescine transport system permease protein
LEAVAARKLTLRDRISGPSASGWGLGVYAVILFAFLYLPIVVIGVFSFVDNDVAALPLGSFTWDRYSEVINNDQVITALRNSIIVGLGAVVIAVSLGVPGAMLVDRHDFPGKGVFRKFVLLPLILPGVITGIAFLTFFNAIGLNRSLLTVTLAHGTALVSTVLTTVYARLLRMDRAPEQASLDLGVPPAKTFFLVTVPAIRTAIIASALLAFTLSFDEIPVTIFTIGADNTLPMYIWSALRSGNQLPELNALATMIAAGGALLVVASALLTREQSR